MAQFTVRLPDELNARLEKMAETRGVNRSEILRLALETYLGVEQKKEESRLDRLASQIEDILEVIAQIQNRLDHLENIEIQGE